LPVAYCLLPIGDCLLPVAGCLLPIAYWLLAIAYCLLPIAYCLFAVHAPAIGDRSGNLHRRQTPVRPPPNHRLLQQASSMLASELAMELATELERWRCVFVSSMVCR
jgi:hypothetical protein